jgi:hypothetical protein
MLILPHVVSKFPELYGTRSFITEFTSANFLYPKPDQSNPLPPDRLSENSLSPFNAGIKSLRATLLTEIFYWGFLFLKDSPRDVFISRSALKG